MRPESEGTFRRNVPAGFGKRIQFRYILLGALFGWLLSVVVLMILCAIFSPSPVVAFLMEMVLGGAGIVAGMVAGSITVGEVESLRTLWKP